MHKDLNVFFSGPPTHSALTLRTFLNNVYSLAKTKICIPLRRLDNCLEFSWAWQWLLIYSDIAEPWF
ncbi:hypothetical protein XELAEV_18019726mg [Xenopus laevis]|uniref:Uncharacterized protein n=1 Tax=Xenopus laevis TaxID=8355 RepID=A0A974D6C2_XENLA|nr:hypothetical protein XELAEV_18019726mg [Xenopus laevis]